MDLRARHHNPHGNQYPDNDESKEVFLRAEGHEHGGDGDRHVMIRWLNGVDNEGSLYTQLIQLTGGPGNYAFYHPSVKIQSDRSGEANTFYNIGTFTRAQRDQIISLALAVKFEKTSRVNNCQTWMQDLLEGMVNANLISQDKFKEIVRDVPLKERAPELTREMNPLE